MCGFGQLLRADSGIPIPAGTWTFVLTHGLPAEANGWEQLVYVPPIKQSVMLSQYHQRNSEPDESLVGYNFDTNSWDVLDVGGNFHTESIPEGGESQGYFGFDSNNNTIIYHCCTSGSNQSEDINHDWWYDVLGQSGRDKQTSPKPPDVALLPGGTFDPAHNVFIFHGGASFVGTWAYDPVGNSWLQMHPTGTLPDPSLALPGLAYSTVEQKVYLFGGQSETSGAYTNDLYVYDYPTNSWSLISPAGGIKPPGRSAHGFAYDSTNNIFLVYGGAKSATGILNDTWVYDPVANTWTQVTTPAPGATNTAVYAKLSYDSDHNVFVMAQIGGGGGYYGGVWNTYGIKTYLFRYAGGGPNAGAQTSTASNAAGGLNRYNTGWAKDPALASAGGSLYVTWSEESSPFSSVDDAWPHIYASQYTGGNWVPLGTSFTSISKDIFEAHAPSVAIVAGVPWLSYYQSSNTGQTAQVYTSAWDGVSNWNAGVVGLTSTGSLYQGQSQITSVGGTPHVALLEMDRSVYPQRTMALVSAWNGSGWSFKGAPLNHSLAAGDTALSISIASDGVNPVVAWNEYVHSQNGNGYNYDTNPQVSVAQWNGSQWVALGSVLNVNTANWAYDPSIAYLGGTFYVAWVERTQVGNNQLYVKSWNGSSWVLVGSGALNKAPGPGWAFHPSLVADAATNSLYLGWVEQVALGQKAGVFVAKYSGGSWTTLGGALNVDPIQGSAQRVSVGVYNGQPVAAWGEVNLGGTRQVFVKQWNGSSWTQLLGTPVPDTAAPSTPTGLQATTVSPTQISLSWNRSSDLVGVTGYFVSRNGSLTATVTSTLAYVDSGLTPNTPYCYTVAAFDAAGNVSPQSGSVCTAVAVSAVSLSSSTVVGGTSISGNAVTLSGPAPSGGAVVTLSSNSSSATVPASVTVSAGTTVSPQFTINTSAVAANTPVTISATYGGVTATASLAVVPPSPSVVTLSPSTVLGGNTTTANTVTLSGAAPAGGASVSIASNNPAATVPATVVVPAGTTVSPAFSISTTAVSSTTTATISATYGGVTTPATLTINPLAASAVTLSPASVTGGNSTTQNTVTINGPAPAGGAVVTLASNNAAASVPASVTVAAGATTSPAFAITTSAVASTTKVTISAVYGGVTATGTLTVTPATAPVVAAVSLSPTSVLGGNPTTQNTVTLTSPAPAGGAVVALGSSNPAASVPASVTVAAGATTSPAFTIATTSVNATTNAVISATYGGATVTGTLSITSSSGSGPILQLHGNVGEVSGVQNGAVVTPTVGPAGFSGTVKVNSGGSVTFAPTGNGVYFLNCCTNTNNAYYQLKGTGVGTVFGSSQGQITFNLTSRYSFAQRKAQATGQRYTFDVRDGNGTHLFDFLTQISAPYLTFTYAAENVGTTYFVPAGQEDALFGAGVQMQVTLAWNGSVSQLYLNGSLVSSKTATATAGNWTASSTLDVGAYEYLTYGGYDSSDDTISEFTVSALTSPSISVTAPSSGASVSGAVPVTATATAALGIASVQFRLDGSNLGVAVTTAPYSINWNSSSASNGNHSLTAIVTDRIGNTATSGAVPVTVNNTVSSPVVTLSPTSVTGGKPTTQNTVTLPAAAPAGGAVVTLSSNSPAATVPASVTVAAGATTSPAFTITTTAVTATTSVIISATYGGVTATSTLTVNPPAASAVTLSPASVTGGTSTTRNTVTLTGTAPSGGAVVTLASNNPAASVPASVTVAAGATTSPAFTIATTAVTATTSVTISATYGGTTVTGTLTLSPPTESTVTLSPASVAGGNSTTLNTVTLTGAAPAGGAVVTLASNNPAATVPASVTVAAGATTSPAFTITTTAVASTTTVTISATYGGVTSTGTLTVTPATAPAASAVLLSPTSVLGGNPTTQNTVTLTSPAPTGGAVVTLSSSNPAATVPASVTIAGGATTSPVFTVTTTAVSANTNAVISATYGGATVMATLSITSGSVTGPILQMHDNAAEVSGVQNGAVVTPTVGPAGFSGSVKVNSGGSVNFNTSGDGVYFLSCCTNASNAFYQFKGTGVGTVFGNSQGQISFTLTSRYSFAQRKSGATGQRYTFDVRDGNGSHLFGFETQITSPYLTFAYTAGGSGTTYFVPSGQEDALFGAGVQMLVTIAWNGNSSQLFLNGNLVASKSAANAAGNWTASSVFDLGAYEYLTYGGYDSSDDMISGFTVK